MPNPLTQKLEQYVALDGHDRSFLDEIVRTSRSVDAGVVISDEGDEPTMVHLVLDGIARRYKQSSDDRRQTVAYMVAGDLCDMHGFLLRRMDHSVATMSSCRIVDIPCHRVIELCARPAIQRALWCATLVDEAVLWEWLVNVGTRSSARRLAHFYCELFVRLRAVGRASTTTCPLPLTQTDLGETLGLSTVHINRTMHALSTKGLVRKVPKALFVPDFERLAAFAGFDAGYLHLEGGKPVDQTATTDEFSLGHAHGSRADAARSIPH